MAQWVKEPASLQLPWHRFDPWPGNFHLLQEWGKKKKKKKLNTRMGSSHFGTAETNPISIHEDTGSIPGLA